MNFITINSSGWSLLKYNHHHLRRRHKFEEQKMEATISNIYGRFSALFNILSWWKRRRFKCLVNVDEETVINYTMESEKESYVAPIKLYFNGHQSTDTFSLVNIDSFQGSIESMDSISDSQFLQKEHQIPKPLVCNKNLQLDPFLIAHLNFLRQSTQAQEVELVYRRKP